MKPVLLALSLILTTSLFADTAKAEVAGPIWACSLQAQAKGHSVHFIVGKVHYKGDGTLRCLNAAGGDTGYIPLKISYNVWGLGLGAAKIDSVEIRSIGIKVANPNDVFGYYGALDLFSVNVGRAGLGADLVLQADKDGVGLELGFRGEAIHGADITALNLGDLKLSRQ